MTHQKPTSGYEQCSVADTKTVRSLVPDLLFKKIIGLRPKLGKTYYHIKLQHRGRLLVSGNELSCRYNELVQSTMSLSIYV